MAVRQYPCNRSDRAPPLETPLKIFDASLTKSSDMLRTGHVFANNYTFSERINCCRTNEIFKRKFVRNGKADRTYQWKSIALRPLSFFHFLSLPYFATALIPRLHFLFPISRFLLPCLSPVTSTVSRL